MRLLRGRIAPGAMPDGCVVAIGKFDGLHRGHRVLLDRAADHARDRRLPLVVLSFEPLPHEYFAPATATTRLARFVSKWYALAELGTVDTFACLRFNRRFATAAPEDFVCHTLAAGLGARLVVVGEGFRFGCERRGDVAMLARLGDEHGFEVDAVTAVTGTDGQRISSSQVRRALETNDLDAAAALIGRPYTLWGRVVAGDKLGRRLGFPTANLALGRRPPPLAGIYVVRATGLPEGARYGVANVGTRPSIGGTRRLLEIYFPEYSGDLYGRLLQVEFFAWLRAEAHFADLDALAGAMREDVHQAEQWLSERNTNWEMPVE